MNLYVAIVRRAQPISGVATQPEHMVGPFTEDQVETFARFFEDNFGEAYYVDEVKELVTSDQLHDLIAAP